MPGRSLRLLVAATMLSTLLILPGQAAAAPKGGGEITTQSTVCQTQYYAFVYDNDLFNIASFTLRMTGCWNGSDSWAMANPTKYSGTAGATIHTSGNYASGSSTVFWANMKQNGNCCMYPRITLTRTGGWSCWDGGGSNPPFAGCAID